MRTTCACLGTLQRTAKLQLRTASAASAAMQAGFILLRKKEHSKAAARQTGENKPTNAARQLDRLGYDIKCRGCNY